MTTGSHSEPCINWPCAKGAGHAGPCGTSRGDLTSNPRALIENLVGYVKETTDHPGFVKALHAIELALSPAAKFDDLKKQCQCLWRTDATLVCRLPKGHEGDHREGAFTWSGEVDTRAAHEPADARWKFIQDESLHLVPFAMPTGAGDADIGWRVLQSHMGKGDVVIAEVYRDRPAEAIDAARAALTKSEQYIPGAVCGRMDCEKPVPVGNAFCDEHENPKRAAHETSAVHKAHDPTCGVFAGMACDCGWLDEHR